jgi:hypothetical protein
MSESSHAETPSEHERGIRLTRRSLVAAGAILTTLGPAAVSRALADGRRHGHRPRHRHRPGDGGPQNEGLCFLHGTRLLTPGGEVAIEELKIGDVVATLENGTRAIRWIGRLEFTKDAGSTWPQGVLPVRITQDALGVGIPQRDLYVSGAHMLYLNGVLISAASLVNGITVTVVALNVNALQYFHVEFDTHDVVVAEGAPCESMLATAESRQVFDNHEEHVALYGHLPARDMTPYAPIASFNGGRSELRSRLRSALAPVLDIRRPVDVVRDNVETRALLSKAA